MGPYGLQRTPRARDERRRVDALLVLGVADERRVRDGGGGGERFRVAEAFGLGGEFGVLPARGSTAATSSSPKRSRSASCARSRARVVRVSSSVATALSLR